jgi:tRNA G46 methylase TrmB
VKNLKGSLPRTGEGIVIDIGTGDGRFVSAMAKSDPNKFFIGIDANVKPLEKPSMKATRKPNKGGLSNVMFVQAAIEDLPEEFDGVADEIHIHFPWGRCFALLRTERILLLLAATRRRHTLPVGDRNWYRSGT